MAPDTHIPQIDLRELERLALEAAVEQSRAETRAGRPLVPHAQVRQELQQFVARMREKIAALRKA